MFAFGEAEKLKKVFTENQYDSEEFGQRLGFVHTLR